jgi:protein phosphatase
MHPDLAARLIGKSGIRFFGDVHGCAAAFDALAEDAIARNLHLHSLGDLTDRGPDSPACMRLACDLHDAGFLDITPGNHCENFARWYEDEPVPVKANGLGLTLRQLESAPDGAELAKRYHRLVSHAPLWRHFGRIYAVHAAFDPRMLGRDGPKLREADRADPLYRLALEGEERGRKDPDRAALGRRSFTWLSRIPAEVTVLIGHSVASMDGLRERRNSDGGRLVHLDTGLARGGPLSYLDVPMPVIRCEDEPAIAPFPSVSETEISAARAAKLGRF